MRTGNTTHELLWIASYANWGYAVPYRGILVLSNWHSSKVPVISFPSAPARAGDRPGLRRAIMAYTGARAWVTTPGSPGSAD